MLTRTRVTCGALPARGARRRVAPAFHETDTMKPPVLAIALALTLPVAASAQAPAPQAATAAPATPDAVENSKADAHVRTAAQHQYTPQGSSSFGHPGQ